jgi:hypothetical protein
MGSSGVSAMLLRAARDVQSRWRELVARHHKGRCSIGGTQTLFMRL